MWEISTVCVGDTLLDVLKGLPPYNPFHMGIKIYLLIFFLLIYLFIHLLSYFTHLTLKSICKITYIIQSTRLQSQLTPVFSFMYCLPLLPSSYLLLYPLPSAAMPSISFTKESGLSDF